MPYVGQYQTWLARIRNDERQLQALQRHDHTVVIAGPGSGKTRVLAMKMAQLLRDEITPPKGIACLTYTRMMAKELEIRLAELEVMDRPNVVVGTVHSFCLGHIVHPFSEVFDLGIPQPIRIAPLTVWNSCLDQARRKVTGRGYDPERDSSFSFELGKYHRQNADLAFEEWKNRAFAQILKSHYELMAAQGYVDFDLIVKTALHLISKSDLVRQILQSKFAWLAIDEYQDLGYPLFRIVSELISHTGIKLFAIGDPNQSIFDFQGTDPKYLIELTMQPQMQPVVKLDRSYRSTSEVISTAKVILPPYCEYNSGETGGACHVFEARQVEQGTLVAQLVRKYLQHGIADNQIAVLHPRRKNGLHNMARDLQKLHIGFTIDKSPFYDRTMNLIQWLEGLATWCLEGWQIDTNGSIRSTFDELVQGYDHILYPLAMHDDQDNESRLRLTDFVWSFKGQDSSFHDWLSWVTTTLRLDQGLEEYKTIYPDEVEEFSRLFEISQRGKLLGKMSLRRFVDLTRGVQLTTLHSSKGMQFEVVIISGVELIRNDENGTRLLYVGITRAKREICLVYSKVYRGFSAEPPQYIQKLVEECGNLEYFHHTPCKP